MTIKFLFSSLICTFSYLSLIQSQIIYTDEVPFVFYANQQVLPAPTSSIVDYSSKLFQAEPVIVVGFSNFHYIKSPQGISFKLQASNISKQSCQIEILDNIGIQDLNVSILAIDRTNFPNIQVIQKTSSNIFQGPSSSSLQEEEVIEFSKFIQQAKGKKQVIVILNGWNSQFPQNPISINALLINDQYYKIQIIREFPNLITSVSYTIIEYSLDSESNIYNIFSYYDSSLSSLTDSTNCLYTQCPDRHVLSQFQIPIIQNIKLPQLGYQNIFLAFNKLKYLVKPQYDYSPFIELSNYSFQINGQFSFSYFVKNRSQFLGVTLNIIFFYQKKCLKSNQKFQGDQCIDDCVNVNPIQPQFCIDCQSGQYFLQDLKICQSIEPSYSYTCYPEKNYKTCVLCNSIQNCLKCEKSLNQLQCIQCEQNYYVYKGSCQISVSSSDSISNTAKAAVGISVVSSTQGSNFMFLTLQKLNLLYMINILMTSELTIFIEQIKGTNPLSYFQYINFFNNHVYIESSEQLIEFQNTNKEFQTSLLVNGGGIVVSILITLIILLSLIVFSSYYMSGTQLGIHTKAQKILQIYQRFGSFLLYTINELILLVSSYAIFLQFAGFMNLKTSYYLAFKIITIIILTIYQSYFIVYYTNLLQQSQDQNFSSNGSQEVKYLVNQFTYRKFLINLLTQEYIQKRKINKYFPIYMLVIENILIPFSIIIFIDNFLVQCILSLSFQLLLCLASIILRPCILLLNNIRLIVDQLCWVFIFIFMMVFGIYQDKFDQALNGEEQKIQNISLFLKILIMIALCINPFIQVLHILIITFKYIKQLYQQHKLKKSKMQESQLNVELQNSQPDFKLYQFDKSDVQYTKTSAQNQYDFSNLNINKKVKNDINLNNHQG